MSAQKFIVTSRGASLVAGISCAMAFVALSMAVTRWGVLPGERLIAEAITVASSIDLLAALRIVNRAGHRYVLVAVAILAWAVYTTGKRKAFSVAAFLTAAPIVAGLTAWAVNRPRPHGSGMGYPSGHVFGAIVVYGFLVLVLSWRVRRVAMRWVAATGVTGLVIAMAMARVALGAHRPADVVGAALAGVAYLSLGVRILGLGPSSVDAATATIAPRPACSSGSPLNE